MPREWRGKGGEKNEITIESLREQTCEKEEKLEGEMDNVYRESKEK